MSPEGTVRIDRLWKRFRRDRRAGSFLYEGLGALRNAVGRGYRWSLRDVDLTFEPGEAVGLIGPNGSGKSTLLKIVHGSMFPTAGSAVMRGRPGALIEIHAGIHPHLSGRDNIYFAGALVGMRRPEVAACFDEIIEFSEIGDALDRLTKHYSSGMRMRLGFAVATALKPDVLLVDEVLAVGDESFQRRSIDRMRTMHADGTTIVYVSHDLDSVASFCDRTVRLSDGIVVDDGPTDAVIDRYRRAVSEADARVHGDGVSVVNVAVTPAESATVRSHGDVVVTIELTSDESRDTEILLGFGRGGALPTIAASHRARLTAGHNLLRVLVRSLPLAGGNYGVWLDVRSAHRGLLGERVVGWIDVAGPAPTSMTVASSTTVAMDATWDVTQGP